MSLVSWIKQPFLYQGMQAKILANNGVAFWSKIGHSFVKSALLVHPNNDVLGRAIISFSSESLLGIFYETLAGPAGHTYYGFMVVTMHKHYNVCLASQTPNQAMIGNFLSSWANTIRLTPLGHKTMVRIKYLNLYTKELPIKSLLNCPKTDI